MPLISVMLSEELKDKINEYKSDINVSDICREALNERIEVFKRMETITKVPKSIIKKLRSERLEISDRWSRFGQEDAEKLFLIGRISYEDMHKTVYGSEILTIITVVFKKRYPKPRNAKSNYVGMLARGIFHVSYIRGFVTEIERLLKEIDADLQL